MARRYRKTGYVWAEPAPTAGRIQTPEGVMEFAAGDYLVSDSPPTHIWPVKRALFERTYVPLPPEADPAPGTLYRELAELADGAYWRDYGTHYSMCPVSDDNDPVVVVAVYEVVPKVQASRAAADIRPDHVFRAADPDALCPTCGVEAVWHVPALAKLASLPVGGLDVERLARALDALDTGPDGDYSHTYVVDSSAAFAAAIAREYEALR